METLEDKTRNFERKVKDLLDEITKKDKQIEVLEKESQKSSTLISSTKSLKDELASVQIFSCKTCNETFMNGEELKVHKQEKHVRTLLEKVEKMQEKILRQRNALTSSLLKLKEKEFKSKQTCRCKGFCKITHLKHNYFKSEADELCEKMNKVSKDIKEQIQNLGTLSKCLICSLCAQNFPKKDHIKKHINKKQSKQNLKNLTIDRKSLKPKTIQSKKNIQAKKRSKEFGKAKVKRFVEENTERLIDDSKGLNETSNNYTSCEEKSESELSSAISSTDQSISETKSGEVSDSGGMSEY